MFFMEKHKNICCGYSLESPHRGICFYEEIRLGNSNEFPKHMFLWRNKQNYSLIITNLFHCNFQAGDCTLREAVIIASILTKNSIPMLHSAAAILKIAEMDYTGANSIFLRALLDKKYALPYRVVDAVVFHFLR